MLRFSIICTAMLTGCQAKPSAADRAANPDTASPSAQASSDPTSEDTGLSPDDGEPTHTVLAVGSGGGLIAPDGETMVAAGTALRLDLYAADGSALSSVSGTCGGTLDGTQFTTDPVENDCTVLAMFEAIDAEPAAYCSGIPEEMADLVVCDPDLHLDTWSEGVSYWTTDLRIEAGTVLSLPFTANAIGQSGVIEVTNNMPGLVASGMSWRGWFSETPGGDMVHDSPYCQLRSPNPNPFEDRPSPSLPYDCPLGQVERTLYFNMEVRCFADSDICTPGERHPEDYWVGVWARPRD